MKLNREILRLAIPSILANITVPLVGMADIAVAGHLPGGSGAALIGGISIGSMLFDVLYWNFSFLRAGTGGLTAQAYGRKDPTGGILRRALRIALITGLILIALQWAAVWLAFLVVPCSPEVKELATRYFHVRIWAAPATLSLFAFKGWFIGEQDSLRPMVADLLVNGLNILLSIGLGFGLLGLPRLGFDGVAVGTVIAQWSGFVYAACAALRKGAWRPEAAAMPEKASAHFLSLNLDLLLRSMGMVAVYIGFTVLSAHYGDVLLAVSSILMNLLLVFSYFTDGFAYAGEALTGRFIGEQRQDGIQATVRGSFAWGLGVTGLFMLVYGLGGTPLLQLMTSDESVILAGRAFLPWLMLMPLIGCPAFIWDGIFTGATQSKALRNSVLVSMAGFFGFWLCAVRLLHADGPLAIHLLMAAYFVHLAIRSIYLSIPGLRLVRGDSYLRR